MPPFGPEVDTARLACEAPSLSATERGSSLENLMVDVFEHVDGLEVRARNAKSVFENEEFDLVVSNRQLDSGLPWAPRLFSVECKNWSRPVGSAEIAWFATKLRRSSQTVGVLVAASGVTGNGSGRTAAHFEVGAALAEGQTILILALSELEWVTSGEQLADLLLEKQTRLIARREIHVSNTATHRGISVRSIRATSRLARDEALTGLLADSDTRGDGADLPQLFDAALGAATRLGGHEVADGGLVWEDEDLLLAEAAVDALRSAALGCIRTIRRRDRQFWGDDQIHMWLDLLYPNNLWAPPGERLTDLVIPHWLDELAGSNRNRALFCLLGWSLEWRVSIEQGNWPFQGL